MSAPRSIVLCGDSLEVLTRMPDASVDSVVCDPPYGLGKLPDPLEMLWAWLTDAKFDPGGSGFMGKKWDRFVPGPPIWRECLRVLKPGGHLLAFAGSRTVDLMGLAIRIAGFEIRDQLQWLYGTGFPKSLNVSKAIAPIAAKAWADIGCDYTRTQDEADAEGFGTALKPAHEPIILARKPLSGTVAATVVEHGTGVLHIDGCRIGSESGGTKCSNRDAAGKCRGHQNAGQSTSGETFHGPDTDPGGRWPANVILDPEAGAMLDEQSGTRKSGAMAAGTYAGRKSAVYSPDEGRPLARDISASSGGASRFFYCAKAAKGEREAGLDGPCETCGGAELPFVCSACAGTGRAFPLAGELTGGRAEGSAGLDSPRAGAGRKGEGRANGHPTVKPIALMAWLVKLVTPPGGIVLDPFAGSGTTGCAAVPLGFRFVGVDLDPGHVRIAQARIAHWSKGKADRA